MERADSLEKLKQGVFPTGFLDLYPKVSALIIWMMDEKADHRPTAHQLLEFELFSHPEDEDIYLSLQQQLQNKSNVIDELKKKLEKVELEKLEMSQKMDEMQKQLAKYKEAEAMVGIKKCISSPLASFKKKKEVRWSTLNAD
jgi:translation initiation factor 2-alpha kinase 1